MKISQLPLLVLALSFLVLTGMKCKKETPEVELQLPKETQTGTNTFGCLIDGKVFVPKGSFPYSGLTASIQFDILNLRANSSSTGEGIGFGVRDLNTTGEYLANDNNNNFGYGKQGNNYDATDGKITITKYDKINNIISGCFNFNAKDLKTGKTVSITEGRFDLKYTE